MRALLAHIEELRQHKRFGGVVLNCPRNAALSGEFVDLPRPWLDDRLKKLVAHIEQIRSKNLN